MIEATTNGAKVTSTAGRFSVLMGDAYQLNYTILLLCCSSIGLTMVDHHLEQVLDVPRRLSAMSFRREAIPTTAMARRIADSQVVRGGLFGKVPRHSRCTFRGGRSAGTDAAGPCWELNLDDSVGTSMSNHGFH